MALTAFPSSSPPLLLHQSLTKFTPFSSSSSSSSSYLISFSFSSRSFVASPNPRTSILPPKLRRASEEIEDTFLEGDEGEIEEQLEEEQEEEEEESSIDLLFRFLHNVLRKISKQAKKATRSVLPPAIPPQLVSFAVDGVILLTSLSIAKALLEVVCTLGGTVFVVILLLRVIWSTVSYFQSAGNVLNGAGTYDTTQPAT